MAVVLLLWCYGVFGDPTYADAILDRLVHNAHRIDLTGESLRRRDAPDRPQRIDHQPATLPKIYCQQGARQPGDIIPECRATSSRNQRATSSESAVAA
jgi:IstB-like ATP binding protein